MKQSHYYNWPKFTMHCCNKFQWSEQTFNSVHWKAFHDQGKNSTSPAKQTYSSSYTNGCRLEIHSTAQPHQNALPTIAPQKPTVTFSDAPILNRDKSLSNVYLNCELSTQNGRSQNSSPSASWSIWHHGSPMSLCPHCTDSNQPAHIKAVELQTNIGWGCFFKGLCATELQNVVNTQCEAPLNRFKQLLWTSDPMLVGLQSRTLENTKWQ
jgi:hypothetical protein